MKKKLILLLALNLFNLSLYCQTFSNGQSANFAIAATSPSVQGIIGTDASHFTSPVSQMCFAIDPKHKYLYVADYFGNRVLRFDYPITGNLPIANLVFGQSNFTSSGANISASGLNSPQGLAVDSVTGTLWILDMANRRILKFANAHTLTVNNPSANVVLGQPNFATSTSTTSANGLSFNIAPMCGNLLHYDHSTGALWVSDNGNIRVLRYDNALTKVSGANADLVLGQSNFTGNSSGLSANQFARPDGLTTIGNSLFVSDNPNNRILRFDNISGATNGVSASAVIGQVNFTSNTSGISASQLSSPMGLSADLSNLYVSDVNNKRVLIFNNAVSNSTANTVILSNNLTTTGSGAATPSSGGQNASVTMDYVLGQMVAMDRQNNRALVFQSCPALNISISGNDSICSGGTTTLTASGALNYLWSNASGSASTIVSPTLTSAYTVTCSIGNCSTTTDYTVNVIQYPTLVVAGNTSVCAGNTVNLSASGADTYSWSNGVTTNTVSIITTPATTLQLIGTNNSICSSTLPISFTVNPLPVITISGSDVLCSGETGTLSGTGANSYQWDSGATTSTLSINPTSTTVYTLTGTSALGCTASLTKTVTVDNCTGLPQKIKLANVLVSPNPTHDKLFINYLNASMKVEIYNSLGQKILSEQGINGNEISLGNLQNGIYFINIVENDQQKLIKVIKN